VPIVLPFPDLCRPLLPAALHLICKPRTPRVKEPAKGNARAKEEKQAKLVGEREGQWGWQILDAGKAEEQVPIPSWTL
jgi:hypothetical protein